MYHMEKMELLFMRNEKRGYHMRLRNIPGANAYLIAHPLVIKNEARYRGTWKETFEHSENPIHMEIGMGKGQFLLTLARENPAINYIGIERYSSVLLRALERYDQSEDLKDLTNIRFICMDAAKLPDVFSVGELEKIYLNFCDPWPKARHSKRRLTSREFFERYDKVLSFDGVVEFKTDNKDLFEFSLEQVDAAGWVLLAKTFDLHNDPTMSRGNVMTEYEEKFSGLGNPIHKLIAMRQ